MLRSIQVLLRMADAIHFKHSSSIFLLLGVYSILSNHGEKGAHRKVKRVVAKGPALIGTS